MSKIRLLIGQRIGLPFIVPKAIAILQADVLAEGDYYPGDLLISLLGLSEEDWKQCGDEKINLSELLRQNASTIDKTEDNELIRNTNDYLSRQQRITHARDKSS